ncbi:MAG: response regulator transcription factor [Neomegalonema sp.]|nr:response regulator transcription factor [Neomegalonema sp.]
MTRQVYILEDEADAAQLFERALAAEGFQTRLFGRIADFCDALAAQCPDLCIVDLGLPDGDGAELLGRELAAAEAPTIIVSGRGALADKLRGLEAGAEDYLVKPFDPAELAARAQVVLRRRSNAARAQKPDEIAAFAGWRVNFSTFHLIATDDTEDGLSKAEAALLRAFVDAPGRVLSRTALLEICAPLGDEAFDRAIDVRVSRLRKKLGDDPKRPTLIKTVYGAGYVFAAKVEWLSR